jgi:ornithine cyclodeaminase/alanine dehydrogenase
MVLLLDRIALESVLPIEICIPAVEDAFKTYTLRNAIMPQRAVFSIEQHQGAFLVMPAYLGGQADAFATKVVSVYPENVNKHQIPTVLATVCLFDTKTGVLLSVMEGAFITAMRTGAASGVATKYLARQDSTTLGLFGAGIQAKTQALAICAVRDINSVKVYDIDTVRCQQFTEDLAATLSIDVVACQRAREAVVGSDIICTATTSTSPVFKGEWLSPGTHINGIGSYTPETRELDTVTMKRAKVVVDSRTAALQEAGDILIPISEKAIIATHIHAEIGEVIIGAKASRTDATEITVFKSLGLAIQDVVTAQLAYERALDSSYGKHWDFT